MPAVTGAGELKMVVTDMLGQEQVITQDFYASAQMLKPGLSEYSYSLGKMRERFGYASFDYGELAFVGAHRQGIDENWTLGARLELSEVAQLIVEIASEKLASDIVMLDLRGLASFTDYFVIMSADSSRQIQALEEDLATTLKEAKLSLHRREGTAASGWVLMDYSDVLVHIFSPDEREFFGLERLWARAVQVVRIL